MSTSSVVVDGSDNVTTEILVAGYTRETIETFKIVMPNEIIGVIFMFWFIDIGDEWDQSLSHEAVTIVGQCAKLTRRIFSLIYGRLSVASGIYEWRSKFRTGVNYCFIGIIHDDQQKLIKNRNTRVWSLTGDGTALHTGGSLYLGSLISICDGYSDTFMAKDTIISMTLNMDEKTIAYKINDKQYKSKKNSCSIG